MKLFTEIEAELKTILDKAKAAWDRGEKELHDVLHMKARDKAAEAGASISASGQADGVLVAHNPTVEHVAGEAEPEAPAAEPKTD